MNINSHDLYICPEPRYWTPRSERIFSIDKSCTTRLECENEQLALGLQCMRDWYRDWKCTECCQGDRCNFYVTVGTFMPLIWFWPNFTGMIPGWTPTNVVQMVLIGCISWSRGQNIGFQNAIFKTLLGWNYKAQSFYF